MMNSPKTILEYQFPAEPEKLCDMRRKLREVLQPCCQSETLLNCIVLAVGEACMNIIQHAYGHAYGEGECGDIILEVQSQGENIVFRLTDFAHHKSRMEEMKSRSLDEVRPGGLGCHIINEIMDEVKLIDCNSDCGNVLQMKKCLKQR